MHFGCRNGICIEQLQPRNQREVGIRRAWSAIDEGVLVREKFVFIVGCNSVSDKSRSSAKSTMSPEVIFTNEDHTVLDAAVVDVNVDTELAL